MFGVQFQMDMVIMKVNNRMPILELKRLQGPHGKGNLELEIEACPVTLKGSSKPWGF